MLLHETHFTYILQEQRHATKFLGVGDRILSTWDPHGILEEFYVALQVSAAVVGASEGGAASEEYFTAEEQFNYYKRTLYTPELRYVDLLRMAETWYMGAPIAEVGFHCLYINARSYQHVMV